jgi:hypothetical protein
MQSNVNSTQDGTADIQQRNAAIRSEAPDLALENKHGQGVSHATGKSVVPNKLQQVRSM